MCFFFIDEKMSFDFRQELEQLNNTAPILKDRDDAYSDDGKYIVNLSGLPIVLPKKIKFTNFLVN